MKSFQQILEKRVRNNKSNSFDFYTIEKATKQVCNEIFGESGEKNIIVKKWENGRLILSANKSLWRSELALNQKLLLSKINDILNTNSVKKILVV